MGVSLPDDIIISIIRNHLNGRKIFCTLSLVSRSFCEIAQSALFSTVTLSHDGKVAIDKPGEPPVVDDDDGLPTSAVKWPKLEFLAGSDKILSYIRLLAIVLPANTHYPRSELDVYWYETVRGRSVLDALDRWLPSCLDRMSSLDILVYGGPALRGPIHQAILRHKTLQYLKTSAKTRCSVPCKQVLQQKRRGETAIEDLEFMEEGNEMDAFGFLGSGISSIGPRRCAFLSQMVSTHSVSLKMLRIPIFLLYDALRSSPGFPDFPRLSSLYIEDSTELLDSPFLTRLYPEMGSLAVSFILHVHDTLVTLHWGRSVPEEATKQITAGHLPSLENLSGHKIRKLIQSHPLKKLRIVSLRPSDFDSDTDGSLLRETSSRLPNLSIFALSTNIRTMSIIRDLSTFTNVVEMWYEEEHDCVSYDEESKNERLYPYELLHVVVPALPKLRELCMTIRSDIGSTSSPVAIKEDVLISSRSLLRVTIQFVAYSVACCRINLSRESLDGKWGYNTLMGLQWQKSFKF